jgi:hypothetical protein
MKKLLFLFAFLSTFAFGQVQLPVRYLTIPSAPALTAPVTIIPSQDCCGGAIYNSTLVTNSPKHIKTAGIFNRTASSPGGLSLREWAGTISDWYTVVNTLGDVYGIQGSLKAHGVSTTNFGNFIKFYGLSPIAPMVVTGENGFQLPANVGGSQFVIQNAVAKSPAASGATFNFDTSSGSYYENTNISFFRSFNAGQEGICYIGATHPGFAEHNIVKVTHNFSYNSSREGTQFEHINLLRAFNNTCILPGQTGGAGQNNAVQAHDLGPGSEIAFSIYDGAPVAFNYFTHGTKTHDNYFSFNLSTNAGSYTYNSFIGRTDNSYFSTSTRLTGDSIIFDGDYFNYTGAGTLDYLVQVNERVANIIFRNCKFSSNIAHIMRSERVAGFSNTLTGDIGDHGNVTVSITAPIYVSGYNMQDLYSLQGLLVTSSPYHALHIGYRTP